MTSPKVVSATSAGVLSKTEKENGRSRYPVFGCDVATLNPVVVALIAEKVEIKSVAHAMEFTLDLFPAYVRDTYQS